MKLGLSTLSPSLPPLGEQPSPEKDLDYSYTSDAQPSSYFGAHSTKRKINEDEFIGTLSENKYSTANNGISRAAASDFKITDNIASTKTPTYVVSATRRESQHQKSTLMKREESPD